LKHEHKKSSLEEKDFRCNYEEKKNLKKKKKKKTADDDDHDIGSNLDLPLWYQGFPASLSGSRERSVSCSFNGIPVSDRSSFIGRGLAPSRVLLESYRSWAETLLRISKGDQYVTLQNIFLTSKLLFPLFPTSPTQIAKTGIGKYMGRLLITNHLDQSL
jgi:hypothetical protein